MAVTRKLGLLQFVLALLYFALALYSLTYAWGNTLLVAAWLLGVVMVIGGVVGPRGSKWRLFVIGFGLFQNVFVILVRVMLDSLGPIIHLTA